jgi:putative FmdB family regulatory protein
MPLYEYECDACSKRFEVIQKFSESPDRCRVCGKGPVRRLMSSPAIQFKGTGWYITDYSNKGKSSDSESGDSGAPKTDGKDGGGTTTASDSGSSSTATPSTASTPATPAKAEKPGS